MQINFASVIHVKMKKIIIILLGILLVGTVFGINLITDVTYEPVETPERYIGNITFECNGKPDFVEVNEPDMNLDENDFLPLMRLKCNKTITNIRDKDGNILQEIDGIKSFNRTKLERIKERKIIAEMIGVYYCEAENKTKECFGISGGLGTRCYENINQNKWDYCKSGWIK